MISNIAITISTLLITIIFHELAHGYMALAMGDSTAKNMGRLSFNPLIHLDPLGTLSMVLFRFGWAKPVPINPFYFHNRKIGMILVSIAGVFTNMLIAWLSVFLIVNINTNLTFFYKFFEMLMIYNIYFAVFNILPLPPLDGSKLLFALLPKEIEFFFYKYERYFSIILLFFVFSGLSKYILIPATNIIIKFLFWTVI